MAFILGISASSFPAQLTVETEIGDCVGPQDAPIPIVLGP